MSVEVWTESGTGPASYSTGGFVVTTGLSTVNQFKAMIGVIGSAPPHNLEYVRNSPSAGQVTVKVIRHQYDRTTAVGDPNGLPSGVTLRSTSGGTYDSESAHVHSMAHDHAAATSGTPNDAGGGAAQQVGGVNQDAHTHSFDPPNYTGNTGVGSSHNHTWNSLYQHAHALTQTATNMSRAELANGTDLSSVTFLYRAVK